MQITQLIEQAAERSLELSNELRTRFETATDCEQTYTEWSACWDTYKQGKQACRVSFEVNGQKYRVLRQSEAGNNGGFIRLDAKINTRYFIVKTVGKRVIKEKDSPIKLAKILEEASQSALKNQDAIRLSLGKQLLPF
jgi:hypothetical protein